MVHNCGVRPYDRDLEGIFKLQDEIATAVVQQLKLKLLGNSFSKSFRHWKY